MGGFRYAVGSSGVFRVCVVFLKLNFDSFRIEESEINDAAPLYRSMGLLNVVCFGYLVGCRQSRRSLFLIVQMPRAQRIEGHS